jgi:predicted nucleic acid-binding protein
MQEKSSGKPAASASGAGSVNPDSILCDSSSLIALTDSGLLGALIALKQKMKGRILITEGIIEESIIYPMKVPKYSFSAIRLKRALDSKVFDVIRFRQQTVDRILYLANNIFSSARPFHLVDRGEAELVAAAVDNNLKTLVMDERTTRMLMEAPMGLKKHLEGEFRIKLNVNTKLLNEFQQATSGIHVIRSSEIVALAYEARYFKKFKDLEKKAYEAALYAIKFNGCAVGFDEISELVSS